MRSLKHTLIGWVIASVVVLTSAAGAGFYLTARAYLIERFDDDLEERFELLASSIEYEMGELDLGFDELEMDDFGERDGDDEADEDEDEDEDEEDEDEDPLSYLVIATAKGTAYRSPTLGSDGLLPSATTEDPEWLDLPDGRRGRVYTQTFDPQVDFGDTVLEWAEHVLALDVSRHDAVTMSIARDTRELDTALATLRIGLIVGGLGLAAVMSWVVAYGVRRGMRPVDGLARRLARLDASSLDEPIEPGPLPAELRPIVEQYNALLSRVGQAYARERGFSADVAHELRTPLAGLRTTLDVAMAKPRTPEQAAEVFGELGEVTEHMRTLVEALLRLAALEAGTLEDPPGTVRLDEEVRRVWRLVINNGVSHRVFESELTLDADAPIATRPGLLELVLRNILHNAAAYVDEGGTVTIQTTMDDQRVRVVVTNTGSTVSGEDAARVFDRFWRADTSRAGTGRHCGLGLALTRSAVHAMGGTIRAESTAGGSFTLAVTLPRKSQA